MNLSRTNINLPSPSNMNFPLQYKPPPLTKTIPQDKYVNRRSPPIVIWVGLRTLYKVLHDVQVVIIRKIIVSVINTYKNVLSIFFFNVFWPGDTETSLVNSHSRL